MKWATRNEKKVVRTYQLSVSSLKKTALFMPGWDIVNNDGCFCISEALNSGIITKETMVIAVEKNVLFADPIKQKISEFGFNQSKFHTGLLSDFDANIDGYDFAFFDLCGLIDLETARWMHGYFSNRMAIGADISFTVSYSTRNSLFMQECDRIFKTSFSQLSREHERHIGIYDWTILLNLMIIRSIFWKWDFTYHKAIKYADGMPMIAFRLENFRPSTIGWPGLPILETMFEKIA